MKKYIKPSIEIVSFDVKSPVMAYAESSISAEASPMPYSATISANYIPTDIENKVWTKVDDEDWNWEE